MDLTEPMVLANAMIFHDTMTNQMNQTMLSNSYQSSTYPSFYQGRRFDRDGLYYDGVCSEYSFSVGDSFTFGDSFHIPIKDFKDTLSNPITLESVDGREYMKMVMGRMKGLLLVSIFFKSPKTSSIDTIKMTIMERIRGFRKDEEDIVIVVDGERSEEFDEGLLKGLKAKYQITENKIIIRIDKL